MELDERERQIIKNIEIKIIKKLKDNMNIYLLTYSDDIWRMCFVNIMSNDIRLH